MAEEAYVELVRYWATDEFKEKCRQAVENRASEKGGCVHTGGCVNAETHRRRLEARNKETVTLPDLHCYMHMREATGEFVSDRARSIQEAYYQGLAARQEAQQQSGEEINEEEEARAAREIWGKAVGPTKGNRMPGTGGIGAAPFRNSIVPTMSNSRSSTGRSHQPSALDMSAVTELTQKLSEAHRDMESLRGRARLAEQRMEEQTRLAESRVQEQARLAETRMEERMSQFLSHISQQQHMPSSSSSSPHMSAYSRPSSSPPMPPYNPQLHYGSGFQPWIYSPQYSHSQMQHPQVPHSHVPHSQVPHSQVPHSHISHPSMHTPPYPNIDLNNIDQISAFLASPTQPDNENNFLRMNSDYQGPSPPPPQ